MPRSLLASAAASEPRQELAVERIFCIGRSQAWPGPLGRASFVRKEKLSTEAELLSHVRPCPCSWQMPRGVRCALPGGSLFSCRHRAGAQVIVIAVVVGSVVVVVVVAVIVLLVLVISCDSGSACSCSCCCCFCPLLVSCWQWWDGGVAAGAAGGFTGCVAGGGAAAGAGGGRKGVMAWWWSVVVLLVSHGCQWWSVVVCVTLVVGCAKIIQGSQGLAHRLRQ